MSAPAPVPARKTILVVDDFESVRFYHETLLGKAGFATVPAHDGNEALQFLTRQKIDLLMLDLNMPKRSGQELLLVIHSLPQYKDLPVIVITTEAQRIDSANLQANFGCHVLQKPVPPAALLNIVQRYLN